MATVTINIPDNMVQRVIDAYAGTYLWTEADGPKGGFAKKCLIRSMKDVVFDYERTKAHADAIAAVPDPSALDLT